MAQSVGHCSFLAPWRWPSALSLLMTLTFAFSLAGCAGGGSGGSAATPITIQAAPNQQTIADGQSAVLAVLATSSSPLSYQWLREGAAISGASNVVYVTPALTLAESGAQFTVEVRNADNSVTTAPIRVTVTAVAPSIETPPQSQTVQISARASFSVIAYGSQPLGYQWQRNGVDIVGANSAGFSPDAATEQDAGARYRVVVRNAGGEAVSAEALLRVSGATPVVLGILAIGVAAEGQSLNIPALLAGNPPYIYQWWRNGQAIGGASGSTVDPAISLSTGPLTSADSGVVYALSVSTVEGNTRSPDAVITVVTAPLVAAGGAHSLARSVNGNTVWACGDNAYGQLGQGSTTASTAPVIISGLSGVKAVAAGTDHSLALLNDGSVWAWGRNSAGALGDGTQTSRPAPQRVNGLNNVVAIAAGAGRSLAVKADGSLWAWGENMTGALGIGSQNNTLVPTAVGQGVNGFGGIIAVAAGVRHTLALRIDGSVFAFGELSAPSGVQTLPMVVPGLSSISGIAAGEGFSIALDINAKLWSWGLNDSGQLGLGDSAAHAAPTQIARTSTGGDVPAFVGLAAGRDFVLARAWDGSLGAWGAGVNGQLGDGEPASGSTAPRLVGALPRPMVSIAGGSGHALAVRSDGSVYAWGANAAGQLGIGSNEARRAEPVQIPGLVLN